MTALWELFTDGASRGNPGPASYGAVLYTPSKTKTYEDYAYIGETTNNVAEYRGLLAGLCLALEHQVTHLAIRMDSELIVEQMLRNARCRADHLIPLWNEANDLCSKLIQVRFQHVPRAQNKVADALANKALDERKK